MKIIIFTIIGILSLNGALSAQKYDRRYHPQYLWTSFEENFSGNGLDRSVWKPTTRFKRSLGFLVDSALTIKVDNGKLELKMQHAPHYLDSLWKTAGWEHVFSNYIGGEVVTHKIFQYGEFECRAKYALRSGSWPAFWLIGGDAVPCPPGGHGSEIDMAELTCESDSPNLMHVIHRYYPPEDCNVSNIKCMDIKRYHVSRRQKYTTYKCTWTPETIRYFVNGEMVHEVINQGDEWFPSLPMQLILSQQIIQGFDLATEIRPITPQTSYFDWVKVRQFFLAPEITCPDVIPSEATATIEVDPLATQISWQLSPATGFATAEGTGKTAHIVRSPNAGGQGKITYTFQMPSGETFRAEKSFD